jgi:peptidoglycan/xylan/chitin deacetylase (PgdA/CDA1 family)
MNSAGDVIVQAGEGGRHLIHTADSLLRQRVKPSSITLIGAEPSQATSLVRGAASRLGGIVLEGSVYPGLSLNAAIRSASGSFFVVVPGGFTLDDAFIERCAIAFADDSLAAIAPSVAYRTPTRGSELVWTPGVLSLVAILSDTRSVPPVLAVRRQAWESLDGFDETLSGLAEYEFWLRLVAAGHHAKVLHPPLVSRELERDLPDSSDERRVQDFRAVLDRNLAVLDRDMRELLISREIQFGQLRTRHRQLLLQRDEELAELDRLRAETSHHRAYLQHHHRDAFDWGDFRRTDPVSRDWGYDRGVPVDRRHIEDFLCAHSSDVQGAVLEVQEDDFTRALGGTRVTRHDVLDIDRTNQRATVLADLRVATEITSDTYDCVILTQTLHVIDEMSAALRECYRMLKPGGVLLATFPAASRVCLEYGEDGDYWRMTPAGARALFRSTFEPSITSCEPLGNVLTNAAFLYGLSATELTEAEFGNHDPYFPALTGVRAKKTGAASRAGARGVVLLYHRIDASPDAHSLGVAPDVFEAQLWWLRSECHVMSLEDLLSTPVDDLPDRAVALTFDDGYEDNLRIAAPLLQRHQAPAAFFLTTGGLTAPVEYWWDTLERVLLQPATPATLDMSRAGIDLSFPTTTADERQVAHWRLHDTLVHASLIDRNRAIQWLQTWDGSGTPRVRPMVADEVQQLARLPGVTIGAHTVNHLALPDNAQSILVEINDCQVELRRITGQPVELFAYPYGAVDRETAAAVRRACRWGMSCDDRVLGDSFDAARIPRLDVKSWPTEEFANRVLRLCEPA